jgi:hypothetical protein
MAGNFLSFVPHTVLNQSALERRNAYICNVRRYAHTHTSILHTWCSLLLHHHLPSHKSLKSSSFRVRCRSIGGRNSKKGNVKRQRRETRISRDAPNEMQHQQSPLTHRIRMPVSVCGSAGTRGRRVNKQSRSTGRIMRMHAACDAPGERKPGR